MNKTALIAVALIVIAGGGWLYFNNTVEPSEPEGVVCTADAMQCGDGSYVGRTGPNCEFVCPEVEEGTREVTLYYYNSALDQGPGGVQCTATGLVAVTRTVPTPITVEGVVGRLLAGTLTPAEVAQRIETEFPLDGLVLVSADQVGDTLTLTFDDPQSQTVGGSCRTAILWHQISATAKAFTGAAEVRFMPEELFQP